MTKAKTYITKNVTYSLELDGKFFIVENVPARVCIETDEQFFSPATLDKLQEIIWGQTEPIKVIETPVFAFGDACTRTLWFGDRQSKYSS